MKLKTYFKDKLFTDVVGAVVEAFEKKADFLDQFDDGSTATRRHAEEFIELVQDGDFLGANKALGTGPLALAIKNKSKAYKYIDRNDVVLPILSNETLAQYKSTLADLKNEGI